MKYVDDMPWSKGWPWSPRCNARLPKSESPRYYGRCELQPHDMAEPHCLERGLMWIRWRGRADYDLAAWWDTPRYRKVSEEGDVELWHPDSPGTRVRVKPSFLRRIKIIRSPFATLGELLSRYKRGFSKRK